MKGTLEILEMEKYLSGDLREGDLLFFVLFFFCVKTNFGAKAEKSSMCILSLIILI